MEYEYTILCETEGCPHEGKVVNQPVVDADDCDAFVEGYGHGSEDPYDYCAECGQLGVLQDERTPVE